MSLSFIVDPSLTQILAKFFNLVTKFLVAYFKNSGVKESFSEGRLCSHKTVLCVFQRTVEIPWETTVSQVFTIFLGGYD